MPDGRRYARPGLILSSSIDSPTNRILPPSFSVQTTTAEPRSALSPSHPLHTKLDLTPLIIRIVLRAAPTPTTSSQTHTSKAWTKCPLLTGRTRMRLSCVSFSSPLSSSLLG